MMRRPWPTRGCCTWGKNGDILYYQCIVLLFIEIQLTTLTGYVQRCVALRQVGMSYEQQNERRLTGKVTSWVGCLLKRAVLVKVERQKGREGEEEGPSSLTLRKREDAGI
jgi:hypothetical protein